MQHLVGVRRSACPISFALDLFGDKWTLLVVRDLAIKEKRFYGELLGSEEGIATNILADRLARLEEAGVVEKEVDPDNRTRRRYRMTKKGEDLLPVLLEMILWGAKYDSKSGAPTAFVRRAERDRGGLLQEMRASLRKSSRR